MRGAGTSALVIGAGLLLAACASDDPRQGGFFGGLIGLSKGTYDERVASETKALEFERARHQEELDDGEQLDGVIRERESYALDIEREVVALRAELGDLDAEIEALQGEQSLTLDDVARAEADVASIIDGIERLEAEQAASETAKALGADAGPDADPAEFGEPERSADVGELRAYIDKLQAAVDALKETRARQAAARQQAD
jgi:hypothetical protein